MGYSGYWPPLDTDFTLMDVAKFYASWLLTLAPHGLRWLSDDLLRLVICSDLQVPRTYLVYRLRSMVCCTDVWRGLLVRVLPHFLAFTVRTSSTLLFSTKVKPDDYNRDKNYEIGCQSVSDPWLFSLVV